MIDSVPNVFPLSIAACSHAPILEIALLHHALTLLSHTADDGGDTATFVGPSINEFFPQPVFFIGTPFEMNRIMVIRIAVVVLIFVVFLIGTRSMKVVPRRFQALLELLLAYPRRIADDLLGEKDGRRFLPLLTTIWFLVIAMNLTGVVPPASIAGTSLIGIPLILALISYGTFIYAGVKKHPAKFFRNALFPPGVPVGLYIIVTPIEFISTFVLRPITLTLRLLMNMVVGHLLLLLFFLATSFFFFDTDGAVKLFGVGTLVFGFAWTIFEILVAILQAYVFTLLTAVYLQLSLADEH